MSRLPQPPPPAQVPSEPPPHSDEAEQATLGSMLLKRDAISTVVAMIRSEDFYREAHRRIFAAITDLFERDEPADIITVTERLKARGWLEEIGGAVYVTSLLDAVPTAANVGYYVQIVRRDAVKRVLIDLTAEIGHATKDGHSPDELLTLAERTINNLRERLEFDPFTIRDRPCTNRISGADLAEDTASTDVGWLPFLRLEGIVGRGLATLLSSHGKAGKTTLLVHAVRGLLPVRLLWITEEPRSLWRARARRFPELASPNLILVFATGRPWADLLADLRREEADVLIVDTIRAVCGILDENDQAAVTAAIQPLIFLARQRNWALILVHHLRKSAADVGLGHAGSHALVGLVDVAIEMHRDSHATTRRVCRAVSRFEATPAEWVMELRGVEMQVLGDPQVLAAAETVRRVQAILDEVPRSRDEIAALLEPVPSRGTLHHALTVLIQQGRAARIGRGTKGDPHRWSVSKHSFIHDPSLIRERMESGP